MRAEAARVEGTRSQPLLASWTWAIPGVALVLTAVCIPTLIGGTLAFTDSRGVGAFNWVGLDNFAEILQSGEGRGALWRTLGLAAAFVVLTNVIGLSLAAGLNRTLKSRYVLRAVFFAPVALSPLAVGYVWRYIFQFDGPLNEILRAVGLGDWARVWLADPTYAIVTIVVVMLWLKVGLVMAIYLAALAGVPPELEEAASIDGAGPWTSFVYVTLPSIRPAMVITSLYMLIIGLRVFDEVMALTQGGPYHATETLSTEVYKQTFVAGEFGYGAALSLMLTVLTIFFAVLQLWLTRQREG